MLKTILICAALLLATAFEVARSADFDHQLTQLDGKPFAEGKPEDSTLRKISVNALLANYPDEQNLAGDVKFARFLLAQKIQGAKGELALTAEETTLLKGLVGKGYPPLVVGQVWKLLDPATVPASKK